MLYRGYTEIIFPYSQLLGLTVKGLEFWGVGLVWRLGEDPSIAGKPGQLQVKKIRRTSRNTASPSCEDSLCKFWATPDFQPPNPKPKQGLFDSHITEIAGG